MSDIRNRKKKNKEKLVVEFDEDARREFLTGFSKRKQERRKKALKSLEEKAKQERIAARKDYRDALIAEKRKELQAGVEEVITEQIDDNANDVEVVKALASDNEKVDQIVDDFSAHAFGSALVTVTTTVPADEPASSLFKPEGEQQVYLSRLPKNAKISQSETQRQANRLRDKLKNKKSGKRRHGGPNAQVGSKGEKKGKRR